MTYCQKDSYFYIRKESTSNKTMYSPFYKLFHPKNEHKMKSTILPGFDITIFTELEQACYFSEIK